MEKREFFQLQKRMSQRVFRAWGIHTGPFAASHAHFVVEHFQIFHLWRPILIAPEGQYGEKAILPTPEKNESEGFQGLEPPISSQCSRSRANSRLLLLLLLSGVMVGHLI